VPENRPDVIGVRHSLDDDHAMRAGRHFLPRRDRGPLPNREAAAMDVEAGDGIDNPWRHDVNRKVVRGVRPGTGVQHVAHGTPCGIRHEDRAGRESAVLEESRHHEPAFRDEDAPVLDEFRVRHVAVILQPGVGGVINPDHGHGRCYSGGLGFLGPGSRP
jgi:hypothetical protein